MQNTTQNIENNSPKQKSSVISDLELEVIYDIVLYKITFFKDLNCHDTIWDDCLTYLDRLVKHESPELYVCKIKNELREISGTRKPNNWVMSVSRSAIISTQLYIILYYLYRDNKTYTDIILPSLKETMGYFKNPSHGEYEYIQKLLQKLPVRKTPVYTQGAAVDSKLLQEKEDAITELKKEIAKLTEENILLREENKKLKEQDAPEETAFIERGNGKNAKQHRITAKMAVGIINKYNKLHVMQKQEWENILSEITGLSKDTIHNNI